MVERLFYQHPVVRGREGAKQGVEEGRREVVASPGETWLGCAGGEGGRLAGCKET